MKEEIQQIIRDYLSKDSLTRQEVEWLLLHHTEVVELTSSQFVVSSEYFNESNSQAAQEGWQLLASILDSRKKEQAAQIVMKQRTHLWWRYAAAVILVVCATVLYIANRHSVEEIALQTSLNRLPGMNAATLQLADGSIIQLDSLADGILAVEGNTSITKTEDGAVAYTLKAKPSGELVYNTMHTPLGGQYKLMLPDGTGVWLNAGSSLTYPVAFTGTERRVKAKGELYFEVAPHANQPFIVETKEVDIQVLGTAFNISNYDNEPFVNTTLLEGAIKVHSHLEKNSEAASVRLAPGQQAVVSKNTTQSMNVINVENPTRIIAWKDGVFNFDGADLKSVMRQLERWYKIEVRYGDKVENVRFKGRLFRNTNLSEVLKVLSLMDIQFKMEGNILYVN